ncbi:hypothetical protein MGYG_07369 [Nannizzia gypsea CBS 118893]|uniref:Uncharacterized protein n=1 Tax=Arthroderma gypseum (strain ATCC MYA-4604 / CBS 118893) TaxID=535722 RepID=E4V2Y7_ARTGP|nr:hypothetical protein MGYG_07369 [Nannizzia gypsea CBS 118893]EFR04361.1 hypothetical protein MGYG_07369 [Nannizzia gypsea CBS 118893]
MPVCSSGEYLRSRKLVSQLKSDTGAGRVKAGDGYIGDGLASASSYIHGDKNDVLQLQSTSNADSLLVKKDRDPPANAALAWLGRIDMMRSWDGAPGLKPFDQHATVAQAIYLSATSLGRTIEDKNRLNGNTGSSNSVTARSKYPWSDEEYQKVCWLPRVEVYQPSGRSLLM